MALRETVIKRYGRMRRSLYKRWLRFRLKNRDFTLFASNCVGGIISSNLGQRFNSPTIQLLIGPQDYVRFLERLEHYLSCELREIETDKPYPVGMLDDVRIDFIHYPDFEAAKAKWEERSGRIYWDNIYIILVEPYICDRETVERFDALPHAHKVFLARREYPGLASVHFMPEAQANGGFRHGLTTYKGGGVEIRRWIDDFDYVAFLNQK